MSNFQAIEELERRVNKVIEINQSLRYTMRQYEDEIAKLKAQLLEEKSQHAATKRQVSIARINLEEAGKDISQLADFKAYLLRLSKTIGECIEFLSHSH